MPGLAQRNDQLSNGTSSYYSLSTNNGSVSSNGFWSKHRDDISCNQLHKFWGELSPQARQDLLRIDKQTLFEQARKNMYCSRCNGLLLEGFLQIVMYGKSLLQEGTGGQLPCSRLNAKNQVLGRLNESSMCQDETQDPSVHPWGGLTTTRDGALTLLDCYLYSKSLKGLQNVFDSARARERERELLYPDACGGGGRGWISQGMASYGRGHGTRETCALHTARLSCDTLVDFWSALGEETRQSLLRMKEEDFIERLMYRFDSKRFCRDCRRNVIREFKELKELKRIRREPRCTNWFCVADTAFQYEVSNDTIHADWHQTFVDSVGTYHHFEWAVGTAEGKSDILDFDNVGMNGSVQVNGLDLDGLNACYVTLRAWKLDGRCTEHSVKAHALKGQQCVHCRLIVGDGYVTITRGESIRRFFEHAEEAEEEEDDDSMDKDGNDLDGECSRPQKHAKSPELAREFLLDAATVIFKEQVEKAFREGTARQNAHSIFVCLALKLLEERVHVACKEIITLEKQMKLLEEEEKEKREEEERKERKRTKEREKKLRRKERLRGKDRERKCVESNQTSILPDVSEEASSPCINEELASKNRDLVNETGHATISRPVALDAQDQLPLNDDNGSDLQNDIFNCLEVEHASIKVGNDSFLIGNSKVPRRKLKFQREFQLDSTTKWPDRRRITENGPIVSKLESRYYDDFSECCSRGINGLNRQSRTNVAKFNIRNGAPRFNQKLQLPNTRSDLHSCGCNQQNDYRARVEPHVSASRLGRDSKSVNKLEAATDLCKPLHRSSKLSQTDYPREISGRPRSKIPNYTRDLLHTKKVWEPVEPQKRYSRSNSDSDVTLRSCVFKVEGIESDKSAGEVCPSEVSVKPSIESRSTNHGVEQGCQSGFHMEAEVLDHKEAADEEVDSCITSSCNFNGTSDFSPSSNSSSDNCSSCLSEGDSNTTSLNLQNLESSSASDSEDGCQQFEGRGASVSAQSGFSGGHAAELQKTHKIIGEDVAIKMTASGISPDNAGNYPSWNSPTKTSSRNMESGKISTGVGSLHQSMLSQVQNIHFPIFQAPSTMGYYHQNPVSWSTAPANGLMAYPHPNQYVYSGPFSYGLTGDAHFCMQYGAVQHLPSPLMNPGQLPVYQPVVSTNGFNTQGQREGHVPKASCVRDPSGEFAMAKVIRTGHHPAEAPCTEAQNVKPSNLQSGNTSFSLFQFGGPVALSTYKANSQSSNEGLAGDVASCLPADLVEADQACSKKETTIEEYNLFAASKGIKFSIF
ncbi:hypothetical protein Ancab_013730 [Ancistrocladus abbreviatus]